MIDINIIVPDSIVIAFFKATALPLANVLQTCHNFKLHETQWKYFNFTVKRNGTKSSIKAKEKTDSFLKKKTVFEKTDSFLQENHQDVYTESPKSPTSNHPSIP